MPLNLTKIYNQHLDITGMGEHQRLSSLRRVFDRDFQESVPFFKQKPIYPTPSNDGTIPMDILFAHLTTQVTDKKTRKREFELERSKRLHWVRFHLDSKKQNNMLIFSVKEPEGNRTYIYDQDEKYVVIIKPLLNCQSYYLLTAYYIEGRDDKRNKIEKKYDRRLDVIL